MSFSKLWPACICWFYCMACRGEREGGFELEGEAKMFKSLGMRGNEPVGMVERPSCIEVEFVSCWGREL